MLMKSLNANEKNNKKTEHAQLKPLLQMPNCEHLKITSLKMSYSFLPLFGYRREKVPARVFLCHRRQKVSLLI